MNDPDRCLALTSRCAEHEFSEVMPMKPGENSRYLVEKELRTWAATLQLVILDRRWQPLLAATRGARATSAAPSGNDAPEDKSAVKRYMSSYCGLGDQGAGHLRSVVPRAQPCRP